MPITYVDSAGGGTTGAGGAGAGDGSSPGAAGSSPPPPALVVGNATVGPPRPTFFTQMYLKWVQGRGHGCARVCRCGG